MILLISDLHLQEQRPDITRAFLHFLEGRARNADALYILGDFFEAWIGDDAMSPYQAHICQALRALSDSGTRVFLMHGNRDFLIGEAFCRAAGCTLLSDPSVIDLDGENVLLMHGDLLCTRDEHYLKLRRVLRHPLTLWTLRHLPVSWRQKLARRIRSQSRAHTRRKASDIVDVTLAHVPEVLSQAGVTTLIHGHTHRPAVHKLQVGQAPARRIVLGDWDRQGWVLEWDKQGARLEAFELT